MPTCEKCWADAHRRAVSNPTRSQVDHYYDLLEERKDNPCSPEEQGEQGYPMVCVDTRIVGE